MRRGSGAAGVQVPDLPRDSAGTAHACLAQIVLRRLGSHGSIAAVGAPRTRIRVLHKARAKKPRFSETKTPRKPGWYTVLWSHHQPLLKLNAGAKKHFICTPLAQYSKRHAHLF